MPVLPAAVALTAFLAGLFLLAVFLVRLSRQVRALGRAVMQAAERLDHVGGPLRDAQSALSERTQASTE